MSLQKVINEFWDNQAQPALMRYIEIPAKSTAYDRLWESHGFLKQCCELGKNWISIEKLISLSIALEEDPVDLFDQIIRAYQNRL